MSRDELQKIAGPDAATVQYTHGVRKNTSICVQWCIKYSMHLISILVFTIYRFFLFSDESNMSKGWYTYNITACYSR